jgi:GGDEF domain-containing protein
LSNEETCSLEEAITASKELAAIVDSSSNSTKMALVRMGGSAFATALGDELDKNSAATALYAAGRLLAEVGKEITSETEAPDRLDSVLMTYGMSLVYAANIIFNR